MITSMLPGWLALQKGARRVRTTFLETTFAQAAWDRTRRAAVRWGWLGAVLGALGGLLAFAPAAWLAGAVARASDGRVLLADARGTIWNGSALPMLTGGAGSRDATALPERMHWRMRPRGMGFELRATQACCLQEALVVQLRPGLGRLAVELRPVRENTAQWPAAWLAGLGTPWNTLQLGGQIGLASPGLTIEVVQGRWRISGHADIELRDVASRISPLEVLGSYRLTVHGNAEKAEEAAIQLETLDGALLLSGSGQWAGAKMRFRGEARADEGAEEALNNLLNIIGRRQGALSVISIG